jgi:membrane-associated phospholipid phosphatase
MNSIKNKQGLSLITLKVILVSITFLACILIFAFIANETVLEKEANWDHRVADYLQLQVSAELISVMRIITFFGSPNFLLPAYTLLVVVLLIKNRKRDAMNIAIVAITSTALLFGVKEFFRRSRPDLPLLKSLTTFSFPSGHALSSFIFCSVLAYLVFKSGLRRVHKWLITFLLLVFSLLIGISRIILRMHYATDVIAGFCLGIAWVIISFWLMKKTEEKKAIMP